MSSDFLTSVGARLKYFMDRKGMTGLEVAHAAQVKASFIYDIINGKSQNPSAFKLDQVLRVLDINIRQLVNPHASYEINHSHMRYPIEPVSESLHEHVSPENPIGLNTSCLQQKGLDASTFRYATLHEDGMAPRLMSGDIIIVNTAERITEFANKIFLLNLSGRMIARRLGYSNHTSQTLYVAADKEGIATYECSIEEAGIIGRILWCHRPL